MVRAQKKQTGVLQNISTSIWTPNITVKPTQNCSDSSTTSGRKTPAQFGWTSCKTGQEALREFRFSCFTAPSRRALSAAGAGFWHEGAAEEGSGSPATSPGSWTGGEPPQGYLALRLWRWGGPPLRPRSLRRTQPNRFSAFSPLVPRGFAAAVSPPSWVSLRSRAALVEALAADSPSHSAGLRNSVVGVLQSRGCPLRSLHLN